MHRLISNATAAILVAVVALISLGLTWHLAQPTQPQPTPPQPTPTAARPVVIPRAPDTIPPEMLGMWTMVIHARRDDRYIQHGNLTAANIRPDLILSFAKLDEVLSVKNRRDGTCHVETQYRRYVLRLINDDVLQMTAHFHANGPGTEQHLHPNPEQRSLYIRGRVWTSLSEEERSFAPLAFLEMGWKLWPDLRPE